MSTDELSLWGHSTRHSLSRPSNRPLRRLIIALRLAALLTALLLVMIVWRVMARLPWQVDAGLTLVAALAWAYRFERQP